MLDAFEDSGGRFWVIDERVSEGPVDELVVLDARPSEDRNGSHREDVGAE